MSYERWCLVFYSPIFSHVHGKNFKHQSMNVAQVTGHIQRLEFFQHLVHAISYVW